jgi:hypothetical protein
MTTSSIKHRLGKENKLARLVFNMAVDSEHMLFDDLRHSVVVPFLGWGPIDLNSSLEAVEPTSISPKFVPIGSAGDHQYRLGCRQVAAAILDHTKDFSAYSYDHAPLSKNEGKSNLVLHESLALLYLELESDCCCPAGPFSEPSVTKINQSTPFGKVGVFELQVAPHRL